MHEWLAKIRKFVTSEQAQQIALIVGGVFILLNAVIYIGYRKRTYPNTSVNNHRVGSIPPSQLHKKVSELKLVPGQVSLTYKDKTSKVSVNDLGMQLNSDMLTSQAMKRRSGIPIFNFFV